MMERLVEDPGTRHWPIEIKLKTREKRLEVQFENGQTFWYPAEYLRISAVEGDTPPPGCRHIGIVDIEAVDKEALQITFDDGFENAVFTWDVLYKLGKNYEENWAEYLRKIETLDLNREPAEKAT